MNQKGFSLIIVLLVVGGVLIGAGIWYYEVNKHAPPSNMTATGSSSSNDQTVASTSSAIGTSGWRTYQNAQYGFQIKYPPDWTMDPPDFAPAASNFNFLSPIVNGWQMSFDVQAIPTSGLKANTLDGYVDEIRAPDSRLLKKEDVSINGYPAVREVTVDTLDNPAQAESQTPSSNEIGSGNPFVGRRRGMGFTAS